MKQLDAILASFLRDERGATAIEYALIAGLISVAVVTGATQIGTQLSSALLRILPGLQQAQG